MEETWEEAREETTITHLKNLMDSMDIGLEKAREASMLNTFKRKLKQLLPLTLSFAMFTANVDAAGRILFLPQDNRPVSYQQTVEVAEAAGFTLIYPDENILSRAPDTPGDADALLDFAETNAKNADAAVIATDALLYGGLIPSRKHHISEDKLKERVKRIEKLAEDNPKLKIYLFTSLMRTPKNGAAAGVEEPPYYMEKGESGFEYGADIFRYTSLLDKEEIEGLNADEKNEKDAIKKRLPNKIWNDWMGRREKNFNATLSLLELTKKGKVQALVIGRDDNAPLSETHRENRKLIEKADAARLPKNKFFSMAGIDEFNLLLLARAANDLNLSFPVVYVEYAKGVGGATVPDYSDAPIKETIAKEIAIAGGIETENIDNADVVLMVNSDYKGRTGAANVWNPKYTDFPNDGFSREGAEEFFEKVKEYTKNRYPVAIADIAFVNGADYFLMRNLRDNDMFYKIKAYAGWNTATNSAGCALAEGMFARTTPEDKKNYVLLRRYLDDWCYQTVVRTRMYELLYKRGEPDKYLHLDEAKERIEKETTLLMREFAKEQLPYSNILDNLKITLPWNRMFECKIE